MPNSNEIIAYKEKFETVIRALDNNKTFFDTSTFPWVRDVEAHSEQIRREVDRLLKCIDLLPGFEEIQVEQKMLTRDKRWKILPIYAYGKRVVENERRFPETAIALRAIPGLHSAMFSIMQAKKVIPSHTGPFAGVLRYHLGVKIPAPGRQCGIKVGDDTSYWEEGKSLIFDDSHTHSAWNDSDQDRVVLFVDFQRPLPDNLRSINEYFISAIGNSTPISNSVMKWVKWENAYGSVLDRYVGI
jgi:aspartyl/asparaginyl beta-hydroxylase (cupin superfamily)